MYQTVTGVSTERLCTEPHLDDLVVRGDGARGRHNAVATRWLLVVYVVLATPSPGGALEEATVCARRAPTLPFTDG